MPNADKDNLWAINHNGRWAVKREGDGNVAATHDAQNDAWDEARRCAREAKAEAVMQASDGTIRERSTYGKDPSETPG